MRERFLEDQPVNRRRARSDAEAQGSQQRPYDTKDGAKARQIALERRVADLGRDWNVPMDDQDPSGGGHAIIDMGDGAVYTGYSKTYYPLRETSLDAVYATLTATGTTDTQVTVYRNGSSLGVVTVAAGSLISDPLEPGESFSETDYWQAFVSQAGTGAAGLTLYGEFS